MTEQMIAAEIETLPGQERAAAKALQAAGFKIYHVGPWISVAAPERVWTMAFDVAFQTVSRERMHEIEKHTTWRQPTTEPVGIPDQFKNLIQSVSFAQPPELMQSAP